MSSVRPGDTVYLSMFVNHQDVHLSLGCGIIISKVHHGRYVYLAPTLPRSPLHSPRSSWSIHTPTGHLCYQNTSRRNQSTKTPTYPYRLSSQDQTPLPLLAWAMSDTCRGMHAESPSTLHITWRRWGCNYGLHQWLYPDRCRSHLWVRAFLPCGMGRCV
jgi:hypothetical protein